MLVAYAFELVFITVFYIQLIPWCDTSTGTTYNKPIHQSLCPPTAAHEKCTGGVDKCGCSTVMIHSKCCDTFHQRKKFTWGGWQHKRAIKETAPSFLDATIFFALSIGVGAVGTAASQRLTIYEANVLGFAFLLTYCPITIVFVSLLKTLRRKRLRRKLVSLVVFLFSGAISMIFYAFTGSDRWGAVCVPVGFTPYLDKTIITFLTIYFFLFIRCCRALILLLRSALKYCQPNWWLSIKMMPNESSGYLYCLQRVLGFRGRMVPGKMSEKTFIWLTTTPFFLLTLFGGVCLAIERARMQGIAGKDYQESKMTYGQYLAMLIWVPVLVEYAYVASCKYHTPTANASYRYEARKTRSKS